MACVSSPCASSYCHPASSKTGPDNNSLCVLPHIPNLKQNTDPARQLYKGRPSKCACTKRVHLRLARKRWQKVRWGGKKGGKKCHSSSSKGTRTRGKVGPVGPKESGEGRGYFLLLNEKAFEDLHHSFVVKLTSNTS